MFWSVEESALVSYFILYTIQSKNFLEFHQRQGRCCCWELNYRDIYFSNYISKCRLEALLKTKRKTWLFDFIRIRPTLSEYDKMMSSVRAVLNIIENIRRKTSGNDDAEGSRMRRMEAGRLQRRKVRQVTRTATVMSTSCFLLLRCRSVRWRWRNS